MLASAALVCEAIELDVIKEHERGAKIGLWMSTKSVFDDLKGMSSIVGKSIKIPADKRAIYSRDEGMTQVTHSPLSKIAIYSLQTIFFISTLWPT